MQVDGRLHLVAVLSTGSRPAQTAQLTLGPQLLDSACGGMIA